ncbi:MAG TPA: glycosyltransferase family 39 protein [Flavitalea sp.]|nr:glycosyltransferase family 39 protein [Flavitalea sp.]
MNFFRKHHRILFYSCWILINLLQSAYTELFDDEAYYWVYAQFPSWGYFDHPPMIAWLIKAGSIFFSHELGVRVFVVILNTATLMLIESLIAKKDALLFYAICCSIIIVQMGGMIAVPDLPLLFFSAIFFYVYRDFAKLPDSKTALLLGVVIACMMYSKYHGVLIVLFTLLSNLSLLRRYQTYVAALIALLLFMPHLIWQYNHDFPSVQFHLFERNATSYKFSYTLDYIGGQLLLAGPLIGWLLIGAAFRQKPVNDLQRALKFTMAGFYIFFLLSSFKGRVEANWTVPAMIGVIVLSHQFLQTKKFVKWVWITLPISLLLLIILRIYMVLDLPRKSWAKKDEYHHNKEWVNYFKKEAGDLPIVFINSYQKPSKMWFYGGKASFSMNTPKYRRNNYNYWPIEDSLFGKKVLVTGRSDTFMLKNPVRQDGFENAGMAVIDHFYSFSKVQIKKITQSELENKNVHLKFEILSPVHYLKLFRRTSADSVHIELAIIMADSVYYFPGNFMLDQITQQKQYGDAMFHVTLPDGKYKSKLAISSAVHGHPTLNSTGFDLQVQH